MTVTSKTNVFQINGGQKQIVRNLNELEYVDGYVWANIWGSNDIIKIDAKTGLVSKKYDMSQLKKFNDIEREL